MKFFPIFLCTLAAAARSKDDCLGESKATGFGRACFQSFSYDSESKKCEQFCWGGAGESPVSKPKM